MEKIQVPRMRTLGVILLLCVLLCGAFLAGRCTSASTEIVAKDLLSVHLSGESKPDEGLYLVSIKNHTNYMCYFSPTLGFTLEEGAEGFQYSYLSPPHGQSIGYELLPHSTITLQARLSSGDGFLEDKQRGQIVYPSARDTLVLNVDLRISELQNGTCTERSYKLLPEIMPRLDFLAADLLRSMKLEHLNPSGSNEDLVPLELLDNLE